MPNVFLLAILSQICLCKWAFSFPVFQTCKKRHAVIISQPSFPFFQMSNLLSSLRLQNCSSGSFFFSPPGSNMCLLHVSRWFDSDDIYSCGEHLSPLKKRQMSMCFSLIYLFIYFNESLTHAALRCSRRTTMTRSDRSSWGSSRCSTAPRSRTEGGARRRGAHDRPPPHPWGETQIKVCGEEKKI